MNQKIETHTEAVAALDGVTRRFGQVVALDDISLDVRRGEVLAVLGPNGAGKTTAVKLLLGLIRPTRGKVQLFGENPRQAAARTRTGVMLQVSGVPETMTVREHVISFSSYYPNPFPVNDTLQRAGVAEFADRRFGKLSGGQQQRALYAMAICGNPQILFLDEPTVGMDVSIRRDFWHQVRSLSESGCTIVLTTHYLEEADALADRIIVINKGRKVFAGTPDEIKQASAGKVISCKTRLGPDQLADLPGVSRVARRGGHVELYVSDASTAARALLNHDSQVSDLTIGGAGIEDAFLSLTEEQYEEKHEQSTSPEAA